MNDVDKQGRVSELGKENMNTIQLSNDEVRLLEALANTVGGEKELESLVFGVADKLEALGHSKGRVPYTVTLQGKLYHLENPTAEMVALDLTSPRARMLIDHSKKEST